MSEDEGKVEEWIWQQIEKGLEEVQMGNGERRRYQKDWQPLWPLLMTALRTTRQELKMRNIRLEFSTSTQGVEAAVRNPPKSRGRVQYPAAKATEGDRNWNGRSSSSTGRSWNWSRTFWSARG